MGSECFLSTEPLPIRNIRISDYKESPETGVVFEIDAPARTVFSRVNISYTEGQERRSMLYKGRKGFSHWQDNSLPDESRCGLSALVPGSDLPAA